MKLFKNVKIATKLILGFIIISIIAGVIGGIGIVNIRIINSMDTKMYENAVMPMQNLSIVLETYHRIRANLRDMALSTDSEYRLTTTNKIMERESTLFENLALVAESIRDDKLQDSYNSLNDLLNGKYKEYQDSVINLLNTNQDKQALELIYGDGDDINTEVQTLFDDFYNQLVTQAKQKSDSNTDTSTIATYIMLAVILVSIIAALLLGISISRMISNPIKKLVNAADKLAIGDLSINLEINSKDEIGTLEKSFVEVVNNIKNLIPVIDTLTNACVEGRLDKRAEVGSFKGAYKDIISSLNNMLDTLVGHIDVMPSPVMIIDKEFNIQYMNKLGAEILGTSQKQLIGTKCYDNFKTSDCKTMKCACAGAMQQGTRTNSETDAHPRGMNLEISYSALPIKDRNERTIGAIELISDQTVIKNAQRIAKKQNEYQNYEVTKLLENIENLSQGRLTYNAVIEPTDDDTKEIGDMFKRIYGSYGASIDAINSYIKEIGDILTEMSNCNLNVETSGEYKGDFIEIKNSLDSIINSFNETISNINTASEQVASGSDQISNSSMTLSQGATEQASSIEELTASLEEISSQTKLNAQNANQANDLAENAKTNAIQGNGQMKEMLKAMEEINESSSNISKIIKVIDDIAFQTNILALNAAVEAARAGQHGKGFAVVAEEVRNLAARSANAAKETTEMIEGSIKKAEGGTRIAKDTAEALGRIVTGVEKVANLVSDIAVASNEQASGISQINQGIMQVSQVVQSNSATSEESAAASQELSSQAALMRDMVSRFKLKKSNRSYGKMEGLSPEVLAMLENMTDKKNKHSEPTEDKKNSKLKQVKPRITLSDKEFGKY